VLDEALQFFKSHGYRVVNLTQPCAKGEHPVLSPHLSVLQQKTRSVGLPLVTNGTLSEETVFMFLYIGMTSASPTDPE
jgi:hypothetical protein